MYETVLLLRKELIARGTEPSTWSQVFSAWYFDVIVAAELAVGPVSYTIREAI